MLKKLLTKKTIIIAVIVLILFVLFFGNLFKGGNNGLKTEKVKIGSIIQEVSETGTIKPTQEIALGFKTSGRVAAINVAVSDVVAKGAFLAQLETSQLYMQLDQAKASLAVAQNQYSKLSVDDKNTAQQNLDHAYQDALNVLDDAYLKIYNAYNAVVSLRGTYFGTSDQEGIKVSDSKNIIAAKLTDTKNFLDAAKNNSGQENTDQAISRTISNLSVVSASLKIIRDMCDIGIYYSDVSSADKTIIDNQSSYINTANSAVTSSQQTISIDKIALQKAEDEVDYYQAKVAEAQANINYYQQQISDAVLRAPISGTITKIDKKAGETVQPTELPISLISLDPLQIKVDIYEEDIVKVKIDNPVDIKVAAFPDIVLAGKVVSIDPAEKIVDGVVYYEVTIAFDTPPSEIKPGMTADIVIKTASKENILVLSKEAVNQNHKKTVEVLNNSKIEEREVQTGLEGVDNMVEIISGLSEGEEVVIR